MLVAENSGDIGKALCRLGSSNHNTFHDARLCVVAHRIMLHRSIIPYHNAIGSPADTHLIVRPLDLIEEEREKRIALSFIHPHYWPGIALIDIEYWQLRLRMDSDNRLFQRWEVLLLLLNLIGGGIAICVSKDKFGPVQRL